MMYAPLHAPGWSIALPLIALALYSRLRRSVGRQRVRPRRMSWRIGFLIFGTLMLGLSPPHSPALIAALFAGVAVGVGVAWFSLRHTRFEQEYVAGEVRKRNVAVDIAVFIQEGASRESLYNME